MQQCRLVKIASMLSSPPKIGSSEGVLTPTTSQSKAASSVGKSVYSLYDQQISKCLVLNSQFQKVSRLDANKSERKGKSVFKVECNRR
jgi:hypothetical protein